MKLLESIKAMKKAGQWKEIIEHIFSEENMQAFVNIGLSAMNVMLSKAIAQDRDHYDDEITRLKRGDHSLDARIDNLEERLSNLEKPQEEDSPRFAFGKDLRSVVFGEDLVGIRLRDIPMSTLEWLAPEAHKPKEKNPWGFSKPVAPPVDIEPDTSEPEWSARNEIYYLARIIESQISKIERRLDSISELLEERDDD